MNHNEPRGVVSSLAFMVLIAVGFLCAAGSKGDIPPPGPGPATRAVAESSWLGPAGKYFAVTFFAQPFDGLLLIVVVGVAIWLLVGLALGDGS